MTSGDEIRCIPVAVLDQVDDALEDCVTAALTLSPALSEPYPDDPRWTPYTRWLEPAAERAYKARRELQRAREAFVDAQEAGRS